jgi:tetratricopeptide (TPR) repeat protein
MLAEIRLLETPRFVEYIWPEAKTERVESLAALYMRRATEQQLNGQHSDTIATITQAINCFKLIGDDVAAQKCRLQAMTSARASKDTDAVIRISRSILGHYRTKCDHRQCGETQMTLADYYLEIGHQAEAVASFTSAISYYSLEDRLKHSIKPARTRLAETLMVIGEYIKAEACWRELAASADKSWDRTTPTFRRLLCLMVYDIAAARAEFDNIHDFDRKYTFIGALLGAIETAKIDDFAFACLDYDRITQLGPIETDVLLVIKRQIEPEVEPAPAPLPQERRKQRVMIWDESLA